MVNHPRGHRSRHRSNRSLIRDKDKALPVKVSCGPFSLCYIINLINVSASEYINKLITQNIEESS